MPLILLNQMRKWQLIEHYFLRSQDDRFIRLARRVFAKTEEYAPPEAESHTNGVFKDSSEPMEQGRCINGTLFTTA